MCLLVGDNLGKLGLIPNKFAEGSPLVKKAGQLAPKDQPASHQVVGEVTAHQAYDG